MATEGIVFLYCSYVCNCAKNPNFANCRFSFRKLQIFISQTTDFHFANYRFSFRKLQIFILQTTDFHFVSFHFVSFHFVSLHFVLQTTVSPQNLRSYLTNVKSPEIFSKFVTCTGMKSLPFLTYSSFDVVRMMNIHYFKCIQL